MWAFIPALLTVGAIAVRTALKDKALQQGLAGYQNYVQQVRYRLLPGVWQRRYTLRCPIYGLLSA